MLILLFLFFSFVCIGFLIFSKTEKYKNLFELSLALSEKIGKISKKPRLTGGLKYQHGSDYDKLKQKRARGSIRDDGESN